MTPYDFTYSFLRRNPMNNTERIAFLLKHDKDFAFEHAVMGNEWFLAKDETYLFNRVRRVVLTWVKDMPPTPFNPLINLTSTAICGTIVVG